MPEREDAHLELLTDAEREALERPGLKQRARAIAAATEFATKLGLSNNTLDVIVGRLRELDKPHARLAWETLGNANELLEMLFIDGTLIEETPEAITENVADVVDEQQEEAMEAVSPDDDGDWFESKELNLLRVQKFYKAINDKTDKEYLGTPKDAETIDRDELIGLIALYGAQHDKPKVASRQIDALRDNFLAGTESDSYVNGVRYTVTNKIAELLDSDGLDADLVKGSQAETEPRDTPSTVALVERHRKVSSASIEEMIEQLATREGEGTSYKLENVEWLFNKLAVRGIDLRMTALDFNHAVLAQLATMYSESATIPEEAAKTNVAIMACWLLGVEMKDLVYMRAATKLDAKPQDVHNSKTAFIEGVRKGWERGMRIEFSDEFIEEEPEDEFEAYVPPAEPLHSVPPLKEDVEVVVKHERSLDEEPKHIQVVAAYIDQLGLADLNRRAFEELLNPDTRGEMTPAKMVVLERLKQRIGTVSVDGSVINQLAVSPRAKNAVRQLFGMGFVKHGQVIEHSSVVLKDQLRNIAAGDRRAYIDDFYTGLEALFDELVTPAEELTNRAPLQVIIGDDGKAQLA